jgi:ribonuclease PH
MRDAGLIDTLPIREPVAAISCGIYQNNPILDLDYDEDSAAETDANFVLTASGGIVEIQGTAEATPFSEEQFLRLLRLARIGCDRIVAEQKRVLGLK